MTTFTTSPLQAPHPKVLVADADADSHMLYTTALGFDERELTYTLDGRDALVQALAYPFALVITEVRLPYIDGYTLCEILRKDSFTRTTPIIMVTTDSRSAALQRARQAGADAVLAKPFQPDVLSEEAQRLIRRSAELHGASDRARLKIAAHLDRSTALVARAKSDGLRTPGKSRAHKRYATTRPPVAAATLRCPSCDRPLEYESSQIGGVSAREPEQWDYYACPDGCGRFQYRARTRKLRQV
jgi:two-component system chemotaxis response regulator CheY